MARIREDGERLIELFAEVALPKEVHGEAFILQTYPREYANKEILSSVPSFAYPCTFRCDVITHFSFVLTNINSKWTFGYCRHTPKSDTCLVILSDLPWHSTFFRILDHTAELSARQSSIPLERFLEALYTSDLPQPGLELNITYTCEDLKLREFRVACQDHQKLPCIPEDRNVTEYFSAVNASNMIAIFASMLNERRIVITSDRLNRLSACVQAANALIYPMFWQHIFIPLLPSHLIDYLSAPMPFLIGVPSVTLAQMKRAELGEVVLLNADTNQLTTPFDDVNTLPSEVLHNLRKALKNSNNSATALGDGLCRAFMRALVSLIGGYRSALRIVPGEQITFNREMFVSGVRGTSRQLFLEKMLQLQIFQQFIETRLDMFNAGQRLDDQFEIELNHVETEKGNRFKTQYREWASTMKKEGGAFLRAVNPRVKSAISKSRQAVRTLRSKIAPPTNSNGSSSPRSAPSSPKLPPKIKKSISGTAISQTSRTVTYVRTPNTTTTASSLQKTMLSRSGASSGQTHAKTLLNGASSTATTSSSSRSSTLSVPSLAPSASSESSDVEENEAMPPRVDMNITAELEKIFRNKATLNGSPGTLSSTSTHRPLAASHNVDSSPALGSVAPIPPPRGDKFSHFTRQSLKPAMIDDNSNSSISSINYSAANKSTNGNANVGQAGQAKCLIEFDSPPKDVHPPTTERISSALGALAFDPLLEANYGGGQQATAAFFEPPSNTLAFFETNNNIDTNYSHRNGGFFGVASNGFGGHSFAPKPSLLQYVPPPPSQPTLNQASFPAFTGLPPPPSNVASKISRFEMAYAPKAVPPLVVGSHGGPAGPAPVVAASAANSSGGNPFQGRCWQEFD